MSGRRVTFADSGRRIAPFFSGRQGVEPVTGASKRPRVREVVRWLHQQIDREIDIAVVFVEIGQDRGTELRGQRRRGSRCCRTHAQCSALEGGVCACVRLGLRGACLAARRGTRKVTWGGWKLVWERRRKVRRIDGTPATGQPCEGDPQQSNVEESGRRKGAKKPGVCYQQKGARHASGDASDEGLRDFGNQKAARGIGHDQGRSLGNEGRQHSPSKGINI